MRRGGAKRAAVSTDSAPVSNHSALPSKRVMDALPSFDVRRAEEPPRQHLMAKKTAPLDVKRAESSRQNVRALNTQFASWVQLQLKNHPDELWEDGVKDYLSHASHVMETFKDVVDWLRANATTSGCPAATGSPSDRKNLDPISENSKISNGFSQSMKPASFSILHTSTISSSQSSGFSSNIQPSANFSSSQSSGFSSNIQPSANFSSSHSSGFSSNIQPSANFSSSRSSGFSSNIQPSANFASSQSSGFTSSQSSGLLSFSQTPATFPNLQTSGFTSSQSSGLFSAIHPPASFPSLHKSGTSSSQTAGLFSFTQTSASFSSSQSTGLSSSQSPGLFSVSQTPGFNGTQSFAPQKQEASENVDEEDELERPSSPSVKRTEEEGVTVVHEVKCKVYVKPDKPADKGWKDMGMGQLSIKCKEGASKATKESKPTIVIRNDVGKILLNALIYPGIKMNIQKNTIASIFYTSGSATDGAEAGKSDVVARTYLIRLKSAEETTKLAAAITEYAPSS